MKTSNRTMPCGNAGSGNVLPALIVTILVLVVIGVFALLGWMLFGNPTHAEQSGRIAGETDRAEEARRDARQETRTATERKLEVRVFITTQGGQNIKLGNVPVLFVDRKS